MNFSIDRENKKINVAREFIAPLATVWSAWTQSDMLDKWWAPKPWKAETKSMNFKECGYWLYAMKGPEGEIHWSRFDYSSIEPGVRYSGESYFCDENGNIDTAPTASSWAIGFKENAGNTKVSIELAFDEIADMDTLLTMGFKEGFASGMDNLDTLLAGNE